MKTTTMKILLIIFVLATALLQAQDFDKNLAAARTSYTAGDLENSRFAMEQMLRDLDIAIGKEILKLLPAKLGDRPAVEKSDNLTGGTGWAGLFVTRNYGPDNRRASVEIINNSPLINSIGMILNTPLLGGMMQDENQKQVKVQGYKALLNRHVDAETAKTSYELQVPMNNTLLTVKGFDATESEVLAWANTIPLGKIAQLAQ